MARSSHPGAVPVDIRTPHLYHGNNSHRPLFSKASYPPNPFTSTAAAPGPRKHTQKPLLSTMLSEQNIHNQLSETNFQKGGRQIRRHTHPDRAGTAALKWSIQRKERKP